MKRLICLFLILLLLPLAALCEGYEDQPLYRSDFTFTPRFSAAAFPNDGKAHYADWEKFLGKLSVAGRMDVQRPWDAMDQYVRMDANLRLNGEDTLPFHYESYGVTRYFSIPALDGDSLYFNMLDFWSFMLKPTFFLELPTNLIGMGLYWEQVKLTLELGRDILADGVKGKTHLTHEELVELGEAIGEYAMSDRFGRVENMTVGFLYQICANGLVYDDLCYAADWADALDPDGAGMDIVRDGAATVYSIAGKELAREDGNGWRVSLTDTNGYDFTLSWRKADGQAELIILAKLDGSARLNARLLIDGLAEEDGLVSDGKLTLAITGGALSDNLDTDRIDLAFAYRYEKSSRLTPCAEKLSVDWLNPVTGLPAIGFTYDSTLEIAPAGEIRNELFAHPYLYEICCMNNDTMAGLKAKYMKPVLASLAPVVLETPLGVVGDLYQLLYETGILATLGIEGI